MRVLYHKGGPRPCGKASHALLDPSIRISRDNFPADKVLILLRDETGEIHPTTVTRGGYVMCGACRRGIATEWLVGE